MAASCSSVVIQIHLSASDPPHAYHSHYSSPAFLPDQKKVLSMSLLLQMLNSLLSLALPFWKLALSHALLAPCSDVTFHQKNFLAGSPFHLLPLHFLPSAEYCLNFGYDHHSVPLTAPCSDAIFHQCYRPAFGSLHSYCSFVLIASHFQCFVTSHQKNLLAGSPFHWLLLNFLPSAEYCLNFGYDHRSVPLTVPCF